MVQEDGKELIVEARAHGLDARGSKVDISPEWKAGDPAMITISPDKGPQVKFTILKEGQSDITVVSGKISRKMAVKAEKREGALSVDITPQAPVVQGTKNDVWSDRKKLSYSFGYETGRKMKEQSFDIDPDVYTLAFREGLAGEKAVMTDGEMRESVQVLQIKMAEEKNREAAERYKQSAEKNKEEGAAFLAENAKKKGVVSLPSGLQYEVINAGKGKQPAKTDKVMVNYRGTLIDGTEFANSSKGGKPANISLDKVIKGWAEALPMMKEGAKWTLYVPANLAYGERGVANGPIGPNMALIFEVEIISIQ
jgi:FKBP-type peptidyl-prolyl cis-trans isomerase FklB